MDDSTWPWRALETGAAARDPADLPAAGTDQRLLVPVPERFAGLRWPRFSPDGKRIGFGAVEPSAASFLAPECREGARRWWQPRVAAAHGPPIDLWSIPADGGTPEKLADLGEDDPAIVWSPDGSTIAVIAGCGLYTLPMGGVPQRIDRGAWYSQIDWR